MKQQIQTKLPIWVDRLRLSDRTTFPKRIAAIYGIFNRINGKVYIGRTTCIRKRVRVHRSQLKTGKHFIPELQIDFKTYGPEWFEFRVLEVVHDPADLEAREDEWMAKYPPKRLYNSPLEYERAKGRKRRRAVPSPYVQSSLFEFEFADDVAP